MWQHFRNHVILWAAFNLAFFQRIHLQSPIRPLCSPQFQWHDWYPVTGTQPPLTQPHASAHQAIQNCRLQTGPNNHHSKVLATYLFDDGNERLSPSSPDTIKPPSVRLRPTQTMAYTEQSHNRAYSHSFRIGAATKDSSQSWPSTLGY